jgi:hypothetical protein
MFFLKGLKLGPSLQDKFQAFNEHEKFSTREIKEGECICFILQYNKIYILQYYISHYNLFFDATNKWKRDTESVAWLSVFVPLSFNIKKNCTGPAQSICKQKEKQSQNRHYNRSL